MHGIDICIINGKWFVINNYIRDYSDYWEFDILDSVVIVAAVINQSEQFGVWFDIILFGPDEK